MYLHNCERVVLAMRGWDRVRETESKCEEGAREMHMSVWISICLWRAASGRVYQSFLIIYIQRLISLHHDWEWESRLICIGKSNCWKAVRANQIYGCIDVYIWCFCSVWGAEDKCACAVWVCGDGCNLTAVHIKKGLYDNFSMDLLHF